ncbi:MAG TPA: ABC transporter substrate-binding protein [Acidimicrobiales bacterium]
MRFALNVRATALLVAAGLVASACGSQLDRSEIAAVADRVELDEISATPTPGEVRTTDADATTGSPAVAGSSGGTVATHSAGETTAGTAAATSDGAASTSGARPVSPKSEISIASIGPYSGVLGAATLPFVDGLRIWVAWANSRGGVNGHPIRLLVQDDRADSSRHRALVQEDVEQQEVIAFAQNVLSVAGRGSIDYLQDKQVPVVGHEGGADYVYDHTMYFTPAPSGDTYAEASLRGMAELALPAGATKLATLTCAEVEDACGSFDRVWNEVATDVGFEPVYRARPSIAQPDYTSQCLSAMEAGAEIIAVAFDSASIRRVASACRRQGYTGLFGIASNTTTPDLASDPNLDGSVIGTQLAPWVADTPALREFREAVAQFAPSEQPNPLLLLGWVSGKLFEVAAADLPEPATSQALLAGLWSLDGDDLGGLTHPLAFHEGKPSPRRVCFGSARIDDGTFVAPNGGTLSCR